MAGTRATQLMDLRPGKPDVIYPVGSVLEDEKMIMKVLEFRECHTAHSYKVEVLKWKVYPPDYIQKDLNMKCLWIFMIPSSIPKIKVLQ